MAVHDAPQVILPTDSHTYTLILFHGRGSSGHEFASDLLESTLSTAEGDRTIAEQLSNWKIVFPTALSRHSTVFREDMTEWFDIYSLTDPSLEASLQLEGLREGIAYGRALIGAELEQVPAENLVIGGISQGAAMAIHLLVGGVKRRLGAFVGLSTWMPFANEMRRAAEIQNLDEFYSSTLGVDGPEMAKKGGIEDVTRTPMLLMHSADDDVVDVALGREMKEVMETVGFKVEWKEYDDGGHWLNEPQGINELITFLETVGQE